MQGREFPDYPSIAIWYCEEVVSGRVNSPLEEIQSCQRFLDMVKKAKAGKEDYYWSTDHVVDVCGFVEELPHIKAFQGKIVLEPVQCWWLAGIFGFREMGTNLRWVSNVSIWIPRKNTKTTLATGICLYCANCENESGAEIVISAGSEAQAHIPFDAISATVKKDEELQKVWAARITHDYIYFKKTDAKITVVHSKAQNLDGYNPHVVLAEELHAQSQAVIGVLRTAMGARRNPLFMSISTAGRDTNSPAYEDWKAGRTILAGKMRADRTFTVMYAGSEEDSNRRFDPKVIEKINPLYGVAILKARIEDEILEARKSEGKLQEFLRTRINVWTRAAGNLISLDSWNECEDLKLDLDVFKGYPIFVGIDLASRSDLNAAAFLAAVDGRLYTVGRYWMPREADRMKEDRFSDAFLGWHRDGWLQLTEGTWIDQRVILKEVCEILEGHQVIGIGVDDYQADHISKEFEDRDFPVFIVRKSARHLTPSTEDIIGRVKDPKLFQHDGNPISAWCASNVVGYWDANDNVLPKKEKKNSKANIDGVDALIIANALRLDWEAGVLGKSEKEKAKTNPYLRRGLAGADEDAA